MPLPDADAPEKSRLYEELKSKTALPSATGAITPDLLDNLKNATFVDADNEDQLRRLVLLMQATGVGSMSGPIPGTQQIIVDTQTGTGTFTVFTPGVGEVWQLVGASASGTVNPTGNVTTEIRVSNISDGTSVIVVDQSSSSTSDYPLIESGNAQPILIAYPNVLRYTLEGTFDSANRHFCVIRVR